MSGIERIAPPQQEKITYSSYTIECTYRKRTKIPNKPWLQVSETISVRVATTEAEKEKSLPRAKKEALRVVNAKARENQDDILGVEIKKVRQNF